MTYPYRCVYSEGMDANLITWKAGEYSTFRGYAGGIELFSIHWRTTRTAAADWNMRTTLPGIAGATWTDDARVALERTAEDVLSEWLARVIGKSET